MRLIKVAKYTISFCFKTLLTLIFIFPNSLTAQQNPSAYSIFTKDGKVSTFQSIVDTSSPGMAILFGEFHNNPICHWLQLELTISLYIKHGTEFKIGAEMFERDVQIVIDEYLSSTISESNFLQESRPWTNFKTDYLPILKYAKENQIPFYGSNVPRRYANLVFRNGFEALKELPKESKNFLPPLPIPYVDTLPGYKAMLNMGMGHANANMPKAQALKDATMAHSIANNASKKTTFLHLHGSFHSNNYDGIVWYLNQYNSKLSVVTIATVEQESCIQLNDENKNLADFILCVPERMTKTH